MGFQLTGYVLEKPRVGSANSPFTSSPDNFVSDSATYTPIYGLGADESTPGRTEYLALVQVDGDLSDSEFGWTKNEAGFQRFDYDGSEQRFKPLLGGVRVVAGTLSTSSNTTRIKVHKPTVAAGVAPYRLAVGAIGSGLTFTVIEVLSDGAFGSPAPGVVELSLTTGNLNWNTADLTTFVGQKVYFQRQQFFTAKESSGQLGVAGTDTIFLTPIPGLGIGGGYQKPLLRFGFGVPLTPVDVATEGGFSVNPLQGTFEWARNTGRVRFNSTDLAGHNGEPIYYGGVLFGSGLTLPRQNIGTIASPTSIGGLPPIGGDLLFRALPSFPTGTGTFSTTTSLVDGAASFATTVHLGDIVVLTSGPYTGACRAITAIVSATQVTVAPPFPAVGTETYRVETGVAQFPEFVRLTTAFDATGKSGQVQVNDTSGAVHFASADVASYGSRTAQVVFGDLALERGVSLRFFRSPVNLDAADPTLKDTSAFFVAVEATLANPIVGAPFIFLPVLPIDDPAYPMSFEVQQGTGSFTGILPRLDVPSPPSGVGYTLDFDQKRLGFATRLSNQVTPIPVRTGAFQLSDPLVNPSNAVFALDQGAGFVPLTIGVDALLEPLSGIVTFIETFGVKLAGGVAGTLSPLNTLTDSLVDFGTAGVLAGDLLFILTPGGDKGVYEIDTVATNSVTFGPTAALAVGGLSYEIRRGKEILADRFFQEVSLADPNTKVEKVRLLGAVVNSPRLTLPAGFTTVSRFRFGSTTFSTSVAVVANDGAFTAPASLAQGAVEISASTNNLNFSQIDVTEGGGVYWAHKLTQGKDYLLSPQLGLIQTTERLLAKDELFLTYTSLQDDPPVLTEERATFLVRKELTVHPLPTSMISFNPLGREVVSNPPPAIFRGGRPQDDTQVAINFTTSTITFLPDKLPTSPGGATRVTDALPHGAIVNPNERVYVDYSIFSAIGGENTVTVLKSPISLAQVQLVEGASTFTIKGDRTADFLSDRLLRVNDEQVYHLSGSTYDAGAGETTVTLTSPQVFRDGFSQPKLHVASGPIRLASALFQPSYFVLEVAAYDTIPRGVNRVRVQGDLAGVYASGVVLYLSGGAPTSYNDFYLVTGSTYDSTADRTEIALTQPTVRQYDPGTHTFRRSVRAILEASVTTVKTSATPALPPPFTSLTDAVQVFRQVEGQPGQILSSPIDFTLDAAGSLKFGSPLVPNEEFSILYPKHKIVNPGQFRASFTATITPDSLNGLADQILVGNYTTLSPDSFYYRVETLANFRAEIARQYKDDALSSNPSGGPRTENSSQPKLYEQGQPSFFFREGRLANEDIVARSFLKFYNDAVNDLEDVLHALDGRVVGDSDGRFVFDGNVTNPVRSTLATVTNQIDDKLLVSPFPLPNGTAQAIYTQGPFSRFFKTRRNLFTSSPALAGSEDGDVIAAFSFKSLTSLPSEAFKRKPRAQIQYGYPAGTTTFVVDNANGTSDALQRPAFIVGMRVVIQDAAGAFYINDGDTVTVTAVLATPERLQLSGGPVAPVPAGATIYVSPSDANSMLYDGSDPPPVPSASGAYMMQYPFGKSLNVNMGTGELLYLKRKFPFDGTLPTTFIPKFFLIYPIQTGDILQCNGVGLSNTDTAPYRPPAFYGGTLNDDGDQAVPMVGPTFDGEITPAGGGPLNDEFLAEHVGTGTLRVATTAPYLGTGSLDAGKTVITDIAPFGAPLPKVGDLVRILTGLNGATEFRRITTVGASTLTVGSPFANQDAGFSYTVAVSSTIITVVSASVSNVSTTLTDMGANFQTNGTQVGYTVVITGAGGNHFLRRQVVAITGATTLTVDAPFPVLQAGVAYRIDNPLETYGGTGSILATVASAVATEIATISTNPNSEEAALNAFFATVFTTLLTGGSGGVTGTTLTDLTVNFVTSAINASHFVFIPTGSEMGIYPVASVDSATQITTTIPFLSPAVGVGYQIVSVFGATLPTLQDIFGILTVNKTFLMATQAFQALINSPVPVLLAGVSDPGAFARGLMTTDLDSRVMGVQGRLTYLNDLANGPISKIQKALSGTERLYDKRWVWVDARINLEKGIIVNQARAATERVKAQQSMLKQLTKALAVENA